MYVCLSVCMSVCLYVVSVLESFYPVVKKILGAVLPLSCRHSGGEPGEGYFDSSELCLVVFSVRSFVVRNLFSTDVSVGFAV